jgi:hypothetical protein
VSYIALTNRTFTLLELFASRGGNYYMTIEEAMALDQRPFRAVYVHGWISYRPGRGFHISTDGKRAHDELHHTSIERSAACRSNPLTCAFDAAAYGLSIVQRVQRKRAKPESVRQMLSHKRTA